MRWRQAVLTLASDSTASGTPPIRIYNGKNIANIFIYIILFIVIFQPMVYVFQFIFKSHNFYVRLFTGIPIKSNIIIEAIGQVIEK